MIKRKRDVQTSEGYLLAFLQSISGMSYDISRQITEGVGSIKEFIKSHATDEDLLSNRTYHTKTGKTRRLGKEKAKKIRTMLGMDDTIDATAHS
jgi:hypothetical protein